MPKQMNIPYRSSVYARCNESSGNGWAISAVGSSIQHITTVFKNTFVLSVHVHDPPRGGLVAAAGTGNERSVRAGDRDRRTRKPGRRCGNGDRPGTVHLDDREAHALKGIAAVSAEGLPGSDAAVHAYDLSGGA